MKIKKWDIYICICLAAVLSVFVLELKNITPEARAYPMVLLVCCYAMLAVVVVRWFMAGKERRDAQAAGGMDRKRVLYITGYCAAIYLYLVLLDRIGYVLSTTLFGIFSLLYMKNKNKIIIAAFPLIMAVLLNVLFAKFLYVKLPAGIF